MTGHILDGTSIAVDYWSEVFGKTYFRFLTHVHNDKIKGLSPSYQEYIHTSPFNAWILETKLKMDPTFIVPLDLNKPHVIQDRNTDSKFNVTLMDSKHCPGSVMFLFQGSFGNYLYTGHFCWNPQIIDDPMLKSIVDNKSLDCLYLDNTYAAENCKFPPKYKIVDKIINLIRGQEYHQIIIGLHKLGKEELLEEIGLELNEMIHVSQERFDVIKKLKLRKLFTTDKRMCKTFAVDIHTINIHDILKRQKKRGPILTLFLTGLYATLPKEAFMRYYSYRKFGIYFLPYSDHISHQELREFVSFLRPKRIVPIVELNTPLSPMDFFLIQREKNSLIPKSILALRRNTDESHSICTKVSFSPPDGSLVNNTLRKSTSEVLKRKPLLDSISVPCKIKKSSNNLSESIQKRWNELLGNNHRVGTPEGLEGIESITCTETVSTKICVEQKESGNTLSDTNLTRDILKSNIEKENSRTYNIFNDSIITEFDILENNNNIKYNSDLIKTLKNNTCSTEYGNATTNTDCSSGNKIKVSSRSTQTIENTLFECSKRGNTLDSICNLPQSYIPDPCSINVVDPSSESVCFLNTSKETNVDTSKLNVKILKYKNAPVYWETPTRETVNKNNCCEKECLIAEDIEKDSFGISSGSETNDSICILREYKQEKSINDEAENPDFMYSSDSNSDIVKDVFHRQTKDDLNGEESVTDDEKHLASNTFNIEVTKNELSEGTGIFPIYSHVFTMNKNSYDLEAQNISSKETIPHNNNKVFENLDKSYHHEVQTYETKVRPNFNTLVHLNKSRNSCEVQSTTYPEETIPRHTNNYKFTKIVNSKYCEVQSEGEEILSNMKCYRTKDSDSCEVQSNTSSEETVICYTNNRKLPTVVNSKYRKRQREGRKRLSNMKCYRTKDNDSCEAQSNTSSEETIISHTNYSKLPIVGTSKYYKMQSDGRKRLLNRKCYLTKDNDSSVVQSNKSSRKRTIHYKSKDLFSGIMNCRNCAVISAETKVHPKYIPNEQLQKQVCNDKKNFTHYNGEETLNKKSLTENAFYNPVHTCGQHEHDSKNIDTDGHSQKQIMLVAYNCKHNYNTWDPSKDVFNSFTSHSEQGNYMSSNKIQYSQIKKTFISNPRIDFWNHVLCKSIFSLPIFDNANDQ